MKYKKLSKKEAFKLINASNEGVESVRKVQEMTQRQESMNKQNQVWIISDSDSSFSSINIEPNG